MVGFVAVHVGAGFIARENEADLQTIIRDACQAATNALANGAACEDAAAIAVQSLENSQLTNAGIGSNLNADGHVEADASVMYSRSGNGRGKRMHGFGAVGAAPGLDNPVQVALAVARTAEHGPDKFGRVPPLILAGQGAFDWAVKHTPHLTTRATTTTHVQSNSSSTSQLPSSGSNNISAIDERARLGSVNATPRARQIWQQWDETIRRLEGSERKRKTNCDSDYKDEVNNKRAKLLLPRTSLDTVGAVCVDQYNHVAASASSGGLLFKHRGRVGQAASFGGGCWIGGPRDLQDDTRHKTTSVACCSSGCGESLLRGLVSEKCGSRLLELDTIGRIADEANASETNDELQETPTCANCCKQLQQVGCQYDQSQSNPNIEGGHAEHGLNFSLDLGHGDNSSGFGVGIRDSSGTPSVSDKQSGVGSSERVWVSEIVGSKNDDCVIGVLNDVVTGLTDDHMGERESRIIEKQEADNINSTHESSIYDVDAMSSTGVLALVAKTHRCGVCCSESEGMDVKLIWSFSTPAFGIGYQSTTPAGESGSIAKQEILRRVEGADGVTSGLVCVELKRVSIEEKI